ncbi:MAG TPA: hypothetical protein VLT36_14465 [Candidatus Dormibacteraeota bacterium]|nr:hypothetical protein [Candidatus Dormibacteraeota bacterium]
MKKILILTAVLFGAVSASQAGARFSIGFGLPLAAPAYAVPGYTCPAPVYSGPAYTCPPAVVYHAAPPVYCAPPVVYGPRVVIGYGHGYRGHYWAHGHPYHYRHW